MYNKIHVPHFPPDAALNSVQIKLPARIDTNKLQFRCFGCLQQYYSYRINLNKGNFVGLRESLLRR